MVYSLLWVMQDLYNQPKKSNNVGSSLSKRACKQNSQKAHWQIERNNMLNNNTINNLSNNSILV